MPFVPPRAQQRVLLVTDQLPGHQVGVQASGHAVAVSSFLKQFAERSWPITVFLLRPRVDFCVANVARFPFTLRGSRIHRIGSLYVVFSLRNLVGVVAWTIYKRLPHWIASLVVGMRDQIRRARGFVHVLGAMPGCRDIEDARRVAQQEAPTIILYDGIFNSCGQLSNVPHWVITHDLKHSRAESFRLQGYDVAPRNFTVETEIAALQGIGNIIAIQPDEAAEFKRIVPGARVVVVPATFDPPKRIRPATVDSQRCIFVGSASFHNVDGIEWFLRECWPLIRETTPLATLHVYGSVCSRLGSLPLGVTAHGVVADDTIAEAYANAAAAVVPLRIGSGLKIKAVEAFNYGVPTITTTIGAQGLLHYAPLPFVVEDAPDAFARAVSKTLTDAPTQRRLHARSLQIMNDFRPSNAFREFDRELCNGIAPPTVADSASGHCQLVSRACEVAG